MARSISEIKESIVENFMRNEDVAKTYGFNSGDSFMTHFSKVSVESVLFYVFAVAAWAVENLLDEHKKEVTARIEEILPHRPKWYRDKVLKYMENKVLITDSDEYDTEGMSDSDIASAQVVKHAVATENKDASMLTIKVAGENGGKRCQLDEATETKLASYISEIKDAGVRIFLINNIADVFNCEVDIYYDPMLPPDGVDVACREAIKTHIENLPFNGVYTNMSLVDELQKVEGVKIVEFKEATTTNSETILTTINARYTPIAGYFSCGNIIVNTKAYE